MSGSGAAAAAAAAAVAWSTARAESVVLLRHRLTPLRIVFILASAAALVPPPGASYAIISFGDRALQLSSDTALVAAAVVFSLVGILVFSLSLSVGRARDRASALGLLFSTQSAGPRSILLGRFGALLFFGSIAVLLADCVLLLSLWWRYGTPPGLAAQTVFLAIGLSGMSFAALCAMLYDLLLPASAGARTAVAFVVWSAALVLGLQTGWDVAGLGALRQLVPDTIDHSRFSLGFVQVREASTIAWTALEHDVGAAVADRLVAATAIIAGALAIIAGLGQLLHRRTAERTAVAVLPSVATAGAAAAPARPAPPPAVRLGPANLGVTVACQLRRLLRRSRGSAVILACGFLANILGAAFAGHVAILCAPFLMLAGTQGAEVRVAATLERCEAALQRPDPLLLLTGIIAAVMSIALAPALATMPLLQVATAVLAVVTLSGWLVWTHRRLDAPVLGVGVAGAFVYALALNRPPPGADLFGLWGASLSAFLAQAVLGAGLLFILLLPVPFRRRNRSSKVA